MAVYQSGASGAAVADLQRRLAALGFPVGPIDGIYSDRTAAAVRSYQQSVGLEPDGVAGNITLARLAEGGAPAGAPAAAVQAAPGNPNQMEAPSRVLNPEEDPQFLAFQRAQGVSESELRASIAMQRSRLQRDLANRMPQFDQMRDQASRQVQGNYLSRGLFRSGARLEDENRAVNDVESQRAAAITQTRDGEADLSSQLARQIAESRRRQADESLGARQRVALDAAQVGIR